MAAITGTIIAGAALVQNQRNSRSAARAARHAADVQAQSGQQSIDVQRQLAEQSRQLQEPFRALGVNNISSLQRLVSAPNNTSILGDIESRINQANPALDRLNALSTPQGQADFINNNPFFDSLAQNAQNRIFNNQAARGKLGSGETAAGLRNQLVSMGSDLLSREIGNLQGVSGLNSDINNQGITNLFNLFGTRQGLRQNNIANLLNLVSLGQNAASNQGNTLNSLGVNVGNTLTDIGNAQAAGMVGASNARLQGQQNFFNDLGNFVDLVDNARTN